jgi:dolichyl-phosphate beta-glucosyltransferase
MPATAIVVPCYNEAARLDTAAFGRFVQSHAHIRLILVNDGSRDDTLTVLHSIQSIGDGRVDVLDLSHNGGKAEAIRRGMVHAMSSDAELIGYWDADLATPLEASAAFIEMLHEHPSLDMVMGARVLLLGRTIERNAVRHYAGRVFATAASVVLKLPVYDTQCGAKLFRASPRLARVLAQPFLARWVFDVEIIARFGALSPPYAPDQLRRSIHELPLLEWRHVGGSKVRWFDFVGAMIDVARIYARYIRPGASSSL